MFDFFKKESKSHKLQELIQKGLNDFTAQIISDTKNMGGDPYSSVYGIFIKRALADYKNKLKENLSGIAMEMGITQIELNNMVNKAYIEHINSIFK